MTIADRILNLRKLKGMSQEELADKVGVSRQAVSKWESEQAIPDLEKIIILSDIFEVSTDYLLKGIESDKIKNINSSNIFFYIGTSLNLIGIIIACFIWSVSQEIAEVITGLFCIILGTTTFYISLYKLSEKNKAIAKNKFWKINIWMVAFMPLSLIYNILFFQTIAPYPLLASNLYLAFIMFWIIYIIICTMIIYVQKRNES